MHSGIEEVKINNVLPNIYQPRKYFNKEALKELSKSIKEYGIIQPLTVRKRNGFYELVAGERRLRAAKLANFKTVPCVVVEMTDKESAEVALLENLQRQELNFIEEAEAYFNLITEHNFTQEQLAEKMGKSQSTIANKLRLLKLNEKLRNICIENELTERHARALLSLANDELQLQVIKEVIEKSLNVKKTEELVNKVLLKLAGEELTSDGKRKIKGVFSPKIYINSIKQVFDKFKIPAEYKSKDYGKYIQITVNIPKNSNK